MTQPVKVLIASALEPELIDAIAAVDPAVEVLSAPELLPRPRYAADHTGTRPELTDEDHQRWTQLLSAAEVSFDFDWRAPADLPVTAPGLRWVQATSAGIGQFVQRTGLDRTPLAFTTAAGVHAVPLAEFALTGVLHFLRGVPLLQARQAAHHWERYTATSVRGRRAVVVGLGSIGRETVALLSAAGLSVVGVGRPGREYTVPGADRVASTDDLDAELARADAVVLACPLTEETRGLLDARRLALLPVGAVVVNVARGPVVDEPALVGALQEGRLGGAALDVTAVEPLPADSPLWGAPRLVLTPHAAGGRPVGADELVAANTAAFVAGRPLRNVVPR